MPTIPSAADVPFLPSGNIAATNVQNAIRELDSEKLSVSGNTLSLSANVLQITSAAQFCPQIVVRAEYNGADAGFISFSKNRGGAWIQRLVETVEIQAILIEQLNQKLKDHETRIAALEA